MRSLIRFGLGILLFFEAIVFLGHTVGDTSESTFEWVAGEIVVGVVLVATIVAYRAAGGNSARWMRGLGSAGSVVGPVVGAVAREVLEPRTGKTADVYDPATGQRVKIVERKYGP